MWEDAPNTSKYNVEKSGQESNFEKVYLKLQNLQDNKNYDILNDKISKGEISISINPEMQNRHILGTREYIEGRSYFTISVEELQSIINLKYATGRVTVSKTGQIKETMFIDKIVGIDKDLDGREYETNGIKIHYSKSRTHIVPYREVNLNELEANN